MQRSRKFANPFYGLLLIAGITFVLTATAFCVMVCREARLGTASVVAAPSVDHPLLAWMSRHGEAALTIELSVLALCTFGAIATDDFWQRRARQNNV
jgi:hypothetical protein